jgi:hypothetical protein
LIFFSKQTINKIMPIIKDTPVVIPAKAEKTLPHTWISQMTIDAKNTSNGYLFIQLVPYDSDTDEDPNRDLAKGMQLELWDVVNNVPEAATAMQAIFDAIPAIEAYYDANQEE